jgi:alcohol dehydrogenase class IV
MAFTNGLLGIVHSMAHKTGAAFADCGSHIIHGCANAMYLPRVIEFNSKDERAKARYCIIADTLGISADSPNEKIKKLTEYLEDMNKALGIPTCIKNCGANGDISSKSFMPEDVFLKRVPEIANEALLDACTLSNPRRISQSEMEKLLACCYYGTHVDF